MTPRILLLVAEWWQLKALERYYRQLGWWQLAERTRRQAKRVMVHIMRLQDIEAN